MNKGEVVRWKQVINYAGAFIALLIGSGFATGQEILQYFSAWGYKGILGVLVCFALLAYVGIDFVKTGYNNIFANPNDIYKYYCGNILGTFYDYFSVFFIFLSFIVMVGGAGATVEQHYSLSPYVGGGILTVLAIFTVIFGLNKIVEIIGKIGPIIVVISIFVGAYSIYVNIDQAQSSVGYMEKLVENKEVKVASVNWLLAAGSYVGFCMLWLAAFLGRIGMNAKSEKEGTRGAFFGAFGFSIAVLLMTLGILFSIKDLGASQIPTLLLAGNINPLLANVFSLIILLGIYTTAVPLLWSVIVRFSKEGTKKFKILTLVLGTVAGILGFIFKFDVLVNYVYVLNGYVGLILLFIMLARPIFKRSSK